MIHTFFEKSRLHKHSELMPFILFPVFFRSLFTLYQTNEMYICIFQLKRYHISLEKYTTYKPRTGNFPFYKNDKYVYITGNNNQEL